MSTHKKAMSEVVLLLLWPAGFAAIITLQHGLEIWGDLLHHGWHVALGAVAAGVITGIIAWRWLWRSLGHWVVGLRYPVFFFLGWCGARISIQVLGVPDPWIISFFMILVSSTDRILRIFVQKESRGTGGDECTSEA